MKSAVVFPGGGGVPVNTELLVPPVLIRDSHLTPPSWIVCVGRRVCVCFSERCAYIRIYANEEEHGA